MALALGAAEVALRLADFSYPVFYGPDPFRGAAHLPDTEGWYREEGEAFVRINSAGFRDREHAPKKPDGTFRVAVLGDSYAEAMQVSEDDAFWAVAERELASCPALAGRRAEVLNFGVSGYGTAQEIETLRHSVWRFEPDVV